MGGNPHRVERTPWVVLGGIEVGRVLTNGIGYGHCSRFGLSFMQYMI